MNRYNIRKVFVWPAFKFGAIIGAVLLIFPGILGGIATRSAVDALYALVQAMGGLTMLGGPDTSDLLKLLQTLDNMGPLVVLWTTLFTVIVGGLLCGVMAAVAALIYNLVAAMGGGLEIGAEAVAAPPVPQAIPVPLPAPQVGPTAVAPQIAPASQYQPAPVVQAAMVAQVAAPGQPPVAQPVQVPPVIQPSGPWLAVGANPTQRWPLRPDRTRLGSAAGNEIVLPGLAPQHAEIRLDNGIYVLYDLAAGQTWVNGRPVAGRNMLKEGFQIRLGGQDMVFHAG
jgi:hypothetical protein